MMKMSEAEVSLRLALALLKQRLVSGDVSVAIDGAQIRTRDSVHFRLGDFLHAEGCVSLDPKSNWRCRYTVPSADYGMLIHATPGVGDVVAPLTSGHTLRVESKKGSLEPSASSSEYPLLREAIGQLLTTEQVNADDRLAVAVPYSTKFAALAERWRKAPLMLQCGIEILLVSPDGSVYGMERLIGA